MTREIEKKGKKMHLMCGAGYWFGENEDPLVYEDNIFCGWLSMSSVWAIENAYNSLTTSPNPQNSLFCHAFYRQNVCSKSGKGDPGERSWNEGWGTVGGDWRCSMVTQGVHPIRPYHTLPKEEAWSLCSPQASVILPLRLFSLQLKSLSILPLAKNPGCPLSPFQSITHTSSKFLREDQIFSRINSVCRLWNLW